MNSEISQWVDQIRPNTSASNMLCVAQQRLYKFFVTLAPPGCGFLPVPRCVPCLMVKGINGYCCMKTFSKQHFPCNSLATLDCFRWWNFGHVHVSAEDGGGPGAFIHPCIHICLQLFRQCNNYASTHRGRCVSFGVLISNIWLYW